MFSFLWPQITGVVFFGMDRRLDWDNILTDKVASYPIRVFLSLLLSQYNNTLFQRQTPYSLMQALSTL
jgi:hypothetical protein